jgi:GH43 family beta-xylosidase
MSKSQEHTTYLNPVYRRGCPDPFVLKYCGDYWAYCSGFWYDRRCFGILHSPDLIHWHEMAGALEPLPDNWPEYWAPEVSYRNGRFYMYYSVGNEEYMEIRVAVAEHPAGPFIDSGRRLTTEQFAIDPHLFVDDDGTRYLFYATDFLDRSHIGTGTVRDRLLDPFTLAGEPRSVTLARYDWQVYDPQRASKGGVRWHTIEGSFVLKHKGHYYHMFSGGNWQNISYGVSYALSDTVDRPDEWEQVADGEQVLPVLRTIPDKVIGPGHNSVVRGPDNQQLFCVYHRWADDLSARLMAIDRMDWAGERIVVLGPSTTPQPVPIPPSVAGFRTTDNDQSLGENWQCTTGAWSVHNGVAHQTSTDGSAQAQCRLTTPYFVAEASLKALAQPAAEGAFGINLHDDQATLLQCGLMSAQKQMHVAWREGEHWAEQNIALPPDFDPFVYHLLRIEVNDALITMRLDDVVAYWQGQLARGAKRIGLVTDQAQAAFAGVELTVGWQDLFTEPHYNLITLGWQVANDRGRWQLTEQQLWQTDTQAEHASITKGTLREDYELVINVRLDGEPATDGGYGFYPALDPNNNGPLLKVVRHEGGWALFAQTADSMYTFPLPDSFDPSIHQQFRMRKQHGTLSIQWEADLLGEIHSAEAATRVGLYTHHAAAAFDMVRVTAL